MNQLAPLAPPQQPLTARRSPLRLARSWALSLALLLGLVLPVSALAGGAEVFEIRIKDHRFHPDEVRVPAGKKIKLIIHNDGDDIEEFESFELNREKLVRAGRKISIFLPPLKPGEYPFFGEFHMDTAQGKIIAE